MLLFLVSYRRPDCVHYWQRGALGWPGTETVLVSSANAPEPPAPANNRPQDVARFPIEIDAEANTLPLNVVLPFSVAELPTNHQTLDALAPPVSRIVLPTAVVSAEGAWNTQTSVALPLSVSVPATSIVEFVADI